MVNKLLHWPMLWWGIGGGFVTIIILLSITPSTPVPASIWDKAQHFIAYSWLGFWFGNLSHNWKTTALWLISLGIMLEMVQYFLPFRSFEWLDILANTTGVAIGLSLASSWLGKAIYFTEQYMLKLINHEISK